MNISNPVFWLEDYSEEENIYTLGAAVASLPTTVESIIREVIAFGDIEEYDIWPGVCDCTYKPIIIGKMCRMIIFENAYRNNDY